jgi:error-prone DNA polymerase
VSRDDPAVYDMLCKADSIGVFQVESRAQMNMLPRLKPRCFYDLVIEVAIVRPGPIQGDMVHPYLRRRCGDEPVEFPSPHPDHGPADELHQVLGKTMGVPLFQEQAMRLAMVAAKFSGPEANELRRAMATFRRRGTIDRLREKMVGRMTERGYPAEFAERCFNQIKGFGEYGFPESHAASFAHLVYVSAWIKCHYPAAFAAALLNSQPMGFYAPAQIVACARAHGVEARPPDVNHSLWDCTLEEARDGAFALRLGLRQIDGLREVEVQRLVSTRDGLPAELNPHLFAPPSLSSPGSIGRSSNPWCPDNEAYGLLDARLRGHDREKGFKDMRDLWRRSGIGRASIEKLAAADAFRSLGLDRRQALWEVRGLPNESPLPLFDHAATAEAGDEEKVTLPVMPLSEHVVNDYRTLRLSLKAHPMSFLRTRVAASRILSCADLKQARDAARVSVAGVVLVRQRPGSAQGVVFMTIEDETGVANSVIWPKVLERERKVVMGARLVVVHGRVQRHEDIIHVVAERLEDRSDWLRLLTEDGENLSVAPANADEIRRPEPGSWPDKSDELPLPIVHGDHVKHAAGGENPRERVRERGHPRWHPRHPRTERIIPRSRDFH